MLFLLHVVSPESSSDLASHLWSEAKSDAAEQLVSRSLFLEVSVFGCQRVILRALVGMSLGRFCLAGELHEDDPLEAADFM